MAASEAALPFCVMTEWHTWALVLAHQGGDVRDEDLACAGWTAIKDDIVAGPIPGGVGVEAHFFAVA